VHFKKRYKYWRNLDVPYLDPVFPFGNVREVLSSKLHFGYIAENLYKKLKHHGDYCGIYFFRDPVLLVLSPEFAKKILIQDFHYFMDRGLYLNEKDDPLSANLFFIEGEKWHQLRAKVSPTFTSGKLKQMFFTILDVEKNLELFLEGFAEQNIDIDVKEVLAGFTTDVIGSCAFGIDCNSLRYPDSDFRKYGKKMINFPKLKALKLFFAMLFKKQAKALRLKMNDDDVSDFFINVVRETIESRRNHSIQRKDFMQLLIDLMVKDENDTREDRLTFDEIAAQAFIFFLGGFETTSTTLTYALHLLALNQEIQETARRSIQEILERYDGQWCYEAVMKMEYVGQVIEGIAKIFDLNSSELMNVLYRNAKTLPTHCNLPSNCGS
jgi:cytochrome P450 family 6